MQEGFSFWYAGRKKYFFGIGQTHLFMVMNFQSMVIYNILSLQLKINKNPHNNIKYIATMHFFQFLSCVGQVWLDSTKDG